MELVFGYLAGVLTLINPCVLPVLPIVLASAMQAGRHGPLAIAAGMSLSFVILAKLNERFASATAGFSGSADEQMNQLQASSMKSQFFGGVLLGAVWSPCVGPTLGGAISLASQGESLLWVFAIMSSFALGVSSIILLLGYGTGEAIRRRQQQLRGLAERAKPIMGITFLLVGIMIFFKFHHMIEAWLVNVLPDWFQDLSTTY